MLVKQEYTLRKKTVTSSYVEFELSFTSASTTSFSFLYRRDGQQEWRNDAVLGCVQSAIIRGNVLSNVQLSSNKCQFRWYYLYNDVCFSDDVRVKVHPEPLLSVFCDNEKTVEYTVDPFGVRYLETQSSLLPGVQHDTKVSVNGSNLIYVSNVIYSGLSSPSHVSSFCFNGIQRFLIADTGNERIIEINEYGNMVNILSLGAGATPVYCSYNAETGRVIYVESMSKNVVEVYWKNPPTTETHGSFGTTYWAYNTAYPGNPLSAPVSATFSAYSDRILISDANTVVKVDRSASTRTTLSQFIFQNESGTVSQNVLAPVNLFEAYEYDDSKYFLVDAVGDSIPFTFTSAAHETYNRSLGENSAHPLHSGLYNSIFRPVKPLLLGTEINVTLGVINSTELQQKTDQAFRSFQFENVIFEELSAAQCRGQIDNDVAVWGADEARVGGCGAQSFVCMTGQKLNISIPYPGRKIGFEKAGDELAPVFIDEVVSVRISDVMTGAVSYTTGDTAFNSDISFSFTIPEASQTSYQRSQMSGFHYLHLIEIVVQESYYLDSAGVNSIGSQTYRHFIPVYSFWWRQILKEVTFDGNPVSTHDFVLEDYQESPQQFYDNYTIFPTFHRTVGSTTLTVPVQQKRKIIFDNAFALLTFCTGICPGDSPFSIPFGFDPVEYIVDEPDFATNLHQVEVNENEWEPVIPGLNADYRKINTLDNYPTTGTSLNQYIRDFSRILHVNDTHFLDTYGENGLTILPGAISTINTNLLLPSASASLEVSIDVDDILVSSIDFYGQYTNRPGLRTGDNNLTVVFTTPSSGIQEVVFGIEVDDRPMQVFWDPEGTLRQHTFGVSPALTDSSFVEGVVGLRDMDGEWFYFYASGNTVESNLKSILSNVITTVEKSGRSLVLHYDLHGRLDYLPYTVEVFFTNEDGEVDSTYALGDLGTVFPGVNRKVMFHFGELDEDVLLKKVTGVLTATSPDTAETIASETFWFYFRTPNVLEYEVREEAALLAPVKEGDQPLKRRTLEKHSEWDAVFTSSSYPFIVSSSSSSSWSSSSCSCSSCSCSSCSCSSCSCSCSSCSCSSCSCSSCSCSSCSCSSSSCSCSSCSCSCSSCSCSSSSCSSCSCSSSSCSCSSCSCSSSSCSCSSSSCSSCSCSCSSSSFSDTPTFLFVRYEDGIVYNVVSSTSQVILQSYSSSSSSSSSCSSSSSNSAPSSSSSSCSCSSSSSSSNSSSSSISSHPSALRLDSGDYVTSSGSIVYVREYSSSSSCSSSCSCSSSSSH